MLKKYLYLTTITLSMLIFTSCSEDDSPTGSTGSGGSGGSCAYTSADIEGTWKLESESSSAILTTNENVSVLDGWTQITNPMNLSILLDEGTELLAIFNYLHVNSSDENIVFFLSEESYWSGWGNMFIEIECNIDDLATSCSSFLSYSDGINNINVTLDSLISVGWSSSNGTHALVIDAFNETAIEIEATFNLAEDATISTGSVIISANTPRIIETTNEIQDAWDQSYITFNSDGTIAHFNTLDCSLITPENQYDCYDEGCAPIDLDGTLSGCENINCSALTTTEDCFMWNACVWLNSTCSDYEQDQEMPTNWTLDCDDLNLLTTIITEAGTTTYSVAYNLNLESGMEISQSQDFCTLYSIYGYDCDSYSGPAEDFYGLSGEQIDGLITSTTLKYFTSQLPNMRDGNLQRVDSPIFRPLVGRRLGRSLGSR
jgi:hypothetical protein